MAVTNTRRCVLADRAAGQWHARAVECVWLLAYRYLDTVFGQERDVQYVSGRVRWNIFLRVGHVSMRF